MSCTHYLVKKNKCKNGFPVTAGCMAEKDSKLEARYIGMVHCGKEEWCGRIYCRQGGWPKGKLKALERK